MDKPGIGTIVAVPVIAVSYTKSVASSAADVAEVDTTAQGKVVRLRRGTAEVRFSVTGDATNADPTPRILVGEIAEIFVPKGAALSLITASSATIDIEICAD